MFLTHNVVGRGDKLHGQLTIIDVYCEKDNCELFVYGWEKSVWREENTPP